MEKCMKRFDRIQLTVVAWVILALLAVIPAQAAARATNSRLQIQSIKSLARIINSRTNCVGTTETTQTLKDRHRFPGPKPGDRPTTCTQPSTRTLTMAQRFDLLWLKGNIQLHNRMIKLAQAESEQTTSTELKTFSLELQTSLTLEVAQMKDWLKTWYGDAPTTCPQPVTSECDPLLGGKVKFDLAFINQVIWYERSTMASARCATTAAYHDELKTFAQGLITEGKDVLLLVVAWQELLIKMELEDYLHQGGHWPPWGNNDPPPPTKP